MATTSAAYTPSLNRLLTVPDPTAQWGTPATKLQIQNASPFTLEITCNGEQYTIQSFTAQTMPLDGSGTTVTMLPTSGPAGFQGSITAVWMQKGQSPPMADGQLTGAAQYAQGLGQSLLDTTPTQSGIQAFGVATNPNIRTVIIQVSAVSGAVSVPPFLQVQGGNTLTNYYSQSMYLIGGTLLSLVWTAVVPVISSLDDALLITVTPTGFTYTVAVLGDTALYQEAEYYNGLPTMASVSGLNGSTLDIITGPCRLLTAHIRSTNLNTYAVLEFNGTEIAFVQGPVAGNQGTVDIVFPANTWLYGSEAITLTQGGSVAGYESFASVMYAYP